MTERDAVSRPDTAQPRASGGTWTPHVGAPQDGFLEDTDRPVGELLYGQRAYQLGLDFLDVCDMARGIVAEGKDAYDADIRSRLAGEALMTRLREIGNRLAGKKAQPGGAQLLADTSDVAWSQIRGMGNRTTHEYDAIDHDIIWDAMASHLPQALESVGRALEC